MLEARFQFRYVTVCDAVMQNESYELIQLTDSGGPTGPGGGGSSSSKNNNNNISDGGQLESGSGGTLTRSGSTRGSLRKVLPSLPDMDQQLSMAAKMIDRRSSTPKGNHSYSPYFLEYSLLGEYNLLQNQRVSGVYVMPAANSPLVWLGVIFIRHGAYQEGIFRFNIHIPENFPDGDVPSVIFELPIFHPLIDPVTKELDVRRGFANKWRRNVNHLWHVLLYIRRSFYKIETSNPSNPEAAVLFDSDNELFQVRVRECVEASKSSVFDAPLTADPHAIIFSVYEPRIHDPILQELKRDRTEADGAGKDGLSTKGLSWVQPGTMHIFSKSSTSS
ncbi:AKT-interacting protein-like isoform X2 [Oratosquilla oratoria]|uniref:AKT-interacting protein-like isoform X2 n=2 Tax=Oratosquilla oratoria TaxID=337810 RepID=UPI003F7644DB